jgi:hypothetical protein
MKRLANLALALIVPILLLSVPVDAQACGCSSCQAQLRSLMTATKRLCTCNSWESIKVRNKLMSYLNDAQCNLNRHTVKGQYAAALNIWNYDYELRKLYFKRSVSCDDGAMLDESALQLLICIVDLYYPNSGYDPYANGVISCDQ